MREEILFSSGNKFLLMQSRLICEENSEEWYFSAVLEI
jgi:hypothetical protein